jgi:hypothetical protein
MTSKYQRRFNRWHDKQIEFTSVVINLVFTISVGLVGFLVGQKDEIFKIDVVVKFSTFRTALFLLGISTTIGIILLIVRIYSFKFTKAILQARKDKEKSRVLDDIDKLERNVQKARDFSNNWDKLVHPLLFIQITLLLISIWLLITLV